MVQAKEEVDVDDQQRTAFRHQDRCRSARDIVPRPPTGGKAFAREKRSQTNILVGPTQTSRRYPC
jgi:hypothetical protein